MTFFIFCDVLYFLQTHWSWVWMKLFYICSCTSLTADLGISASSWRRQFCALCAFTHRLCGLKPISAQERQKVIAKVLFAKSSWCSQMGRTVPVVKSTDTDCQYCQVAYCQVAPSEALKKEEKFSNYRLSSSLSIWFVSLPEKLSRWGVLCGI